MTNHANTQGSKLSMTRLAPGLYTITINGYRYDVEDVTYEDEVDETGWLVYFIGDGRGSDRSTVPHETLRSAKAEIAAHAEGFASGELVW